MKEEDIYKISKYYGCPCRYKFSHHKGWTYHQMLDGHLLGQAEKKAEEITIQLIGRPLSEISPEDGVKVAEAATGKEGFTFEDRNFRAINFIMKESGDFKLEHLFTIRFKWVFSYMTGNREKGFSVSVIRRAEKMIRMIEKLGYLPDEYFEQGLATMEDESKRLDKSW